MMLRAGLSTVVLATLLMPTLRADEGYVNLGSKTAQPVSAGQPTAELPAPAPAVQPGYVYLGASMYPSPQPNIPIWTGSTFIPTPALAPHEMLYPHTYRALYPPYYHRVKGCYAWTPFGMKSHEKWELQGTMVQVKYRSHYPLFHEFHPPKISTWGPPWE